ncbi:MAG: hypothetical protein Q8N85_00565 [Candidatus Omnitrophota bacterium]|nr:hypothetical protein [Candidatus Omnitrophota bacterium]
MAQKHGLGIIFVGLVEICIGVVTLTSLIEASLFGQSTKPPEVFIFVLVTSLISLGLGIGILRYNLGCYHLLLYFATLIIFSKLLIFAGIISLNGALETFVPSGIKNTVSVIYHGLLLLYFNSAGVRKRFGEKRKLLSF